MGNVHIYKRKVNKFYRRTEIELSKQISRTDGVYFFYCELGFYSDFKDLMAYVLIN